MNLSARRKEVLLFPNFSFHRFITFIPCEVRTGGGPLSPSSPVRFCQIKSKNNTVTKEAFTHE